MSETPFARRKQKKPELEPKLVIRSFSVPAPLPLTEGEATFSQVGPTEGNHVGDLLDQKKPEVTIRVGEPDPRDAFELFTGRRHPDAEQVSRVTSHPPPPADIPEKQETVVSRSKLTDQITLTPEQAAIWGEAVRPPKNGKNTNRTVNR